MEKHVPPDVEYPVTLAGARQALEDLRDTGERYCCSRSDTAVVSETVVRLRDLDDELEGFVSELSQGRPVDLPRLATTLREVDDLITQLEHRMSMPM